MNFYLQVSGGNTQLGGIISSKAPYCVISAFLLLLSSLF